MTEAIGTVTYLELLGLSIVLSDFIGVRIFRTVQYDELIFVGLFMIVIVLAIVSDVTGSGLAIAHSMRFFHSPNVNHARICYIRNRVLFFAGRGLLIMLTFAHSLHTESLAIVSLV